MQISKSRSSFLGAVLFCASSAFAQYNEIDTMASTIAGQLSKAQNRTVAVVDFTDLQGNVTELGRFLAEELSVSLARAPRGVEVIDRTHLKALLQEHKLAATGIIDPATARKLGEIAGVHYLITGTITPFGDSVRCAVKALDAATARIESASTTEIPKTKTIEELLSKGLSERASEEAVSAAGPSTEQASTQQVKIAQVKELDQFSFGLSSCQQTGDEVVCSLQIMNRAADRKLGLANQWSRWSSRIIDNAGHEYIAKSVRLGSYENNNVTVTLISGVPTAAEVHFTKVPNRLSSIIVLDRACIERDVFTVQFRNIPVR